MQIVEHAGDEGVTIRLLVNQVRAGRAAQEWKMKHTMCLMRFGPKGAHTLPPGLAISNPRSVSSALLKSPAMMHGNAVCEVACEATMQPGGGWLPNEVTFKMAVLRSSIVNRQLRVVMRAPSPKLSWMSML